MKPKLTLSEQIDKTFYMMNTKDLTQVNRDFIWQLIRKMDKEIRSLSSRLDIAEEMARTANEQLWKEGQ